MTEADKKSKTTDAAGGQRIAKAMARSGVASRREAERMIEAGRVSVNGKVITSPALNVTEKDDIVVDGTPLKSKEPVRLWRYHKDRGVITSHKDPQGRPTVFETLPEDMPHVISIGRLDFNTEGLLLLTNDGEVARQLELPKTGWMRRYKVRVYGRVNAEMLEGLENGITIDGIHYGAIEAILESRKGANSWLMIGIREGKNREVRKVMEHLGLTVNRLIRLSYGPFLLGNLSPGEIEEVAPKVVRDQLGGFSDNMPQPVQRTQAAQRKRKASTGE